MKIRADQNSTLSKQKINGFTLIELMVVLMISAILTLISIATYQHSVRRSVLQGEAVALAMRLEQAKTLAQSQNRQYRINFKEAGGSYIPEQPDQADPKEWIAAEAISSMPLALNSVVSYGFPINANIPEYGPPIEKISSATPSDPSGLSAIQFNSRGFPVTPGDPLPLSIRPNNAVYLTEGREFFAVTVDVLGLVRIWAYDGKIWRLISR
jgi:prepilin-type N-terminal cleavage/methylation domain-containing protein